jgi:hypothetical protein
MLLGYVALTAIIIGGCLLIYGIPAMSNWQNTWLPALLGPAILIGGYSLVARLGKRRLEKQIAE